jgi:hypothetical protein
MVVVALVPHGTPAAASTIDGPSAANRQALNAADECLRIIRLDDEMNMVGLHGELPHTISAAARSRECAAQIRKDRVGPQRRKSANGAESDVDRMARIVLGSRTVRR